MRAGVRKREKESAINDPEALDKTDGMAQHQVAKKVKAKLCTAFYVVIRSLHLFYMQCQSIKGNDITQYTFSEDTVFLQIDHYP